MRLTGMQLAEVAVSCFCLHSEFMNIYENKAVYRPAIEGKAKMYIGSY